MMLDEKHDTTLLQTVVEYVRSMAGFSGHVTIHINQGRVTRIDRLATTQYSTATGAIVPP